jgi:hypothetical protein
MNATNYALEISQGLSRRSEYTLVILCSGSDSFSSKCPIHIEIILLELCCYLLLPFYFDYLKLLKSDALYFTSHYSFICWGAYDS